MFSAHFQAVAVDRPSVFGYGENCEKNSKEGNFAPTSSTPTPSETFRTFLSDGDVSSRQLIPSLKVSATFAGASLQKRVKNTHLCPI